jgi:predicted RNase H-like HicB family nuclease
MVDMAERRVKAMGDRRFTVVLQAEEVGGYSVQCVELPQAISQGETKEEALANIREAIELVLEHLAKKAKTQKNKAEFVEVLV